MGGSTTTTITAALALLAAALFHAYQTASLPPRAAPSTAPSRPPRLAGLFATSNSPIQITDSLAHSLDQVAIHAYFIGELEAGARACEKLLQSNASNPVLERAKNNRPWYTPSLRDLAPSARFVQFDFPPPYANWLLHNPTVVATDYGYLALVRSTNYCGFYKPCPPLEAAGGVFNTTWVAVELTPDLQLRSAPRHVKGPEYERVDYPVHGLEDCRLNAVEDGRLVVSGNNRDAKGGDPSQWPVMATAELDLERGELVDFRLIQQPYTGVPEKNWMPFLGVNDFWLYSLHVEGGHTATVVVNGSKPTVERRGRSSYLARDYRGSSQLVKLPDGRWLGVEHEVSFGHDSPLGRAYEHRFVALSEGDYGLAAESRAFYFREARTVEYCAGLAVRGADVVVTFGVRDLSAWAVRVRLDEVVRMLD